MRLAITNAKDPKFKLENFDLQRSIFEFNNAVEANKPQEAKEIDQMSNSAGGDYKNYERTLSGYSYTVSFRILLYI